MAIATITKARCTSVFLLLLPTLFAPDVAGASTALSIAHYEPARNVKIRHVSDPGRPETGQKLAVSLEAYGRTIELELISNDRLVFRLRSRSALEDSAIAIYRGTMPSVQGSWARVAVQRGQLSGVVWDGHELLVLEKAGNLRGHVPPGQDPESLLVIRASDIHLTIDEPFGPLDGLTHATKPLSSVLAEIGSLAAPTRAISLGLVLDARFSESFSDPIQVALIRTNVADGIFSEQANIHIHLENIVRFPAEPDPFTTTNPPELLDELAEIKASRADLSTLGIVHLLTRLDLDGDVLGIARLRSVCNARNSVGLTEARGSIIDGIIMAHEIAHNFGAPHDAEPGSRCQSTPPTFLMSANFNGSSQLSQCSLNEMESVLRSASCLTGVSTSDVELLVEPVPPVAWYQEPLPVTLLVNNTGLESTFDGRIELTTSGEAGIAMAGASNRRCEDLAPQPLQACDLGNLYAGETVTVDVTIVPQAVGPVTVHAAASASNDTNPANNESDIQLTVEAATNLVVDGISNSDIHVRPGGVVAFSAFAHNFGDFETPASIILQTRPGHVLRSSDGCVSIEDRTLECDVGIVRPGGVAQVDFDVLADDAPLEIAESAIEHIGYQLAGDVHELQPIDNLTEFMFVIWGAFNDLQTGFVTEPESLELGESREFVAWVANGGPDPIAFVTFQAGVEEGVELGPASSPAGACTRFDERVVTCELGQMDAGERVELTIPYSGVEAGTYQIFLSPEASGGLDRDGSTNTAAVLIEVTGPPAPPPGPAPRPAPAGSGGGGIGPTALLALGLWLLLRAQAARSNPPGATDNLDNLPAGGDTMSARGARRGWCSSPMSR